MCSGIEFFLLIILPHRQLQRTQMRKCSYQRGRVRGDYTNSFQSEHSIISYTTVLLTLHAARLSGDTANCRRACYVSNCADSSGVPREDLGVFKPPRNSEDPPKSCQTQPVLWKLLKIAEFRTPTPQDVRKKGSKILKLPRFAIVLH